MIRAHAQAIKARLEADTVLAGSTFQGEVLNRPARFCTFYMDSGYREVERFTGAHSQVTFSITVHSAGTTSEQCQLVAERVMAQLLDFTPTVAGFKCRRLIHAASQPMTLDRDVLPPMYFIADQFDLVTTPY